MTDSEQQRGSAPPPPGADLAAAGSRRRPPSADDIAPPRVAALADEFNRLLAAIQVDAASLEREATDPERAGRLAREILAASEELASLSAAVLRRLPDEQGAPGAGPDELGALGAGPDELGVRGEESDELGALAAERDEPGARGEERDELGDDRGEGRAASGRREPEACTAPEEPAPLQGKAPDRGVADVRSYETPERLQRFSGRARKNRVPGRIRDRRSASGASRPEVAVEAERGLERHEHRGMGDERSKRNERGERDGRDERHQRDRRDKRDNEIEGETIDLNALVGRTAETLGRILDGDVEVRTQLHADPLPVRGDPLLLRQALFRLAVAARESLAPGGTLQIETQPVSLTPRQASSIGEARAGEHASVRFLYAASASPHTAPEKPRGPDGRPRTSRFVRGLADAQRIASESRGHLQVAVTPGSPSWLTLVLPLAELPEDKTHQALRESWPPHPASLVLVVDGDPQERSQAALLLRGAGYQVLSAESAEEAAVLLEEEPRSPKLLVTDVVLPGLPGTELADRLGSRYPQLQVIYTSALNQQVIVSCGDLSPDAPFVSKPCTEDRLLPLVRRLVDSPTG